MTKVKRLRDALLRIISNSETDMNSVEMSSTINDLIQAVRDEEFEKVVKIISRCKSPCYCDDCIMHRTTYCPDISSLKPKITKVEDNE